MKPLRHPILAAAVLTVLAAVAGAPAARAQSAPALNSPGIARLNADAQDLWALDGLPLARQTAQAEIQKLVGVPRSLGSNRTARIVSVNSFVIDAPHAPGLTRMDGQGIGARLPIQGSWRVVANVRVNVKGRVLFIPFDDTFNVEIEVRDVVAALRVDLDSSDPAAPRIVRVHPPSLAFDVRLRSANFLVQLASWLTRTTLDPVANALARVGAGYLAQRLTPILAATPQIAGTGGPALAPVAPTDLEAAAIALERHAHATKMPFGTIFERLYRDAYHGTWEQSLTDPAFQPVPGGYEHMFDSTTNTGEWLAGISYRYAVTRSPEALAMIRDVLRATRTVLTMKGTPGDLNRLILPLSDFLADGHRVEGDKYVLRFQGVDYVASDYISRDCYWGIFFGLSHAYDLVDDPALKDEIRQQIEMAIDYLLANQWTWRKRDGSHGERWQGVVDQQYAWLLAAARVNPARYGAVRDRHRGFTDLMWSGFWFAVMDPHDSYYKFELGGGALHVVLRLETDPVAWQRAYQGMAILRRHIGHHQNALLNGFYLAADPSSAARLGEENRNLLTRFLRQPRRKIVVDLTGDPTIEKVDWRPPVNLNAFAPGGSAAPSTVRIARYPIPVERRVAAGYAWTVSPFRLSSGYPVNPHAEGEAMDVTVPYWMSRYYRAIPPPRPVRPTPTGVATASPGAAATSTR